MGSDYWCERRCQCLHTPKSGFDPFHQKLSLIWPGRVHGDYVQRCVSCFDSDEIKDHFDGMMEVAGKKYPDREYAIGLNCFMNIDDDNRTAWEGVKSHLTDFHGPPIPDDLVDRWGCWGNGDEVAQRINSFIDVGVTFFQFVVANPDQFGMMKRIADEVLPKLKGK